MKTKWIVLIIVLISIVSACSDNTTPVSVEEPYNIAPGSPEEVYVDYLHACRDGDLAKVESYLTENAFRIFRTQAGDACVLFLPTSQMSQMERSEFIDDKLPDVVQIHEIETLDGVKEVANLYWCIDKYTTVGPTLIKTNGEWKFELPTLVSTSSICDMDG